MSRLIYLDNAATSYPKPKNVINAVNESLFRCGNPGRSGHELSLYSAKAVYSCREAICSFFNFNHPENVVFTYNTTYALNMAIKGLINDKDEIIISNLEHNSVLRPIAELEKSGRGISYKTFDALGNDDAVIQNFEKAISDKTRLCVITMCSNVTGKILPFAKIGEICKKKRIKLIFDAAQCAGFIPIDLSSLYFSAVCFAGHKSLCGIMGTGFCVFAPDIVPKSIIQGGNGVESISPLQTGLLPERLESGTVGVPGIIALYEGIRHIQSVGLDEISEKCSRLEARLTSALMQIENVNVYARAKNKVSTVLFNINGAASEDTAAFLSSKNICVRAGLHCSPLAHKALGTIDMGAVRASISHFNTGEDIDALTQEIQMLSKR
ncbi:MAG: aminotransferase class V-fold PLP-dependent enzyme [Clostridia bacterium]|nr:aminotransferase class V-fold PLP-dependent enzyme [Clostridia bacterium]